MKKRILLKIVVLSLALVALLAGGCARRTPQPLGPDAPVDAAPDLSGVYVVNGFDPTGTEYSGTLAIFSDGVAGVYLLQWVITGSMQEGRGVVQGNQLVVEWQSSEGMDRQTNGAALYTITVNRELYGTRTAAGLPGEGTETAYPND